MRIDIRQEDIRNGEARQGDKCPIAVRLSEILGVDVDVSDDDVLIYSAAPYYAALPDEAQDFICRFDAGETVKPFCFELKLEQQLKLEQPNGNENQ